MSILAKQEVEVMPIDRLKVHPLSMDLFGNIDEDEFEELKEDIAARGLQYALHVDTQARVICGSQRLRALRELGATEVPVIIRDDLQDEDLIDEHLILDNRNRRQLTPGQIYRCGIFLEEIYARNPTRGVCVQRRVAQALDVSQTTYFRIKKVMESDREDLIEALDKGERRAEPAYNELQNVSREKYINKIDDKQQDLFDFLKVKKRLLDFVRYFRAIGPDSNKSYGKDVVKVMEEIICELQKIVYEHTSRT